MSVLAAFLLFLFFSPLPWRLSSALTTVRRLPSFEGQLPFHMETGYVEVDEVNKAQMFYYFVKSEKNPEKDPLLLWHSGGPGCSSVNGLLLEFGPLKLDVAGFNKGGPLFVSNPYTWTKMSNILFVDAPMGAGFSYSKTSEGYNISDTKDTLQLHTFIRKWFISHPEFLSNPLYVGGDSYGGKISPLLAQAIVNGNQAGSKMHINFKGYIIGNPFTDLLYDGNSLVPFAHDLGLIDDELYELTKRSCDGVYLIPKDESCSNAIKSVHECIAGVNLVDPLKPTCVVAGPKPHKVGKTSLPPSCTASLSLLTNTWGSNDTMRTFGVHKGSVKKWILCIPDIYSVYTFDIPSTLEAHLNLTSRGYRALVYSGDHDLLIPHTGTQAWIKALNFSVVDKWRPWFVDQQVAGYTKTYSNNMTYASVLAAGHAPPVDKPKECQAMFSRWISYAPL